MEKVKKVVYTITEVVVMREVRFRCCRKCLEDSGKWSLLHVLVDESWAQWLVLFWLEEVGNLPGDLIAQWSWQESRVLLALLGQLDRVIRSESKSVMHFLLLDVFRGNLLFFVKLWELLEEWPELVMALLAWFLALSWIVDDHLTCEWRALLLILQLEVLGPQNQIVELDIAIQADKDATFWQMSWLTVLDGRLWHRYSRFSHESVHSTLND